MIVIAVSVLLAFHPGFGFQNKFNSLECESELTSRPTKEGVSLIAVDELRNSE